MVEFNKNGAMKAKDYLVDCVIGGEKYCPIIIITHDECTFSANDGVRKAWTWEGYTFLQPKRPGQGIMTSNFLLSFGWLNLASLCSEKKKEVIEKCGLLEMEAVEIFKYRKKNNGYWDRVKLNKQVVSKVLLIMEALYPRYSLYSYLTIPSIIQFIQRIHFRFKKWIKVLEVSKRNYAMIGLKGEKFGLGNLLITTRLMVIMFQKEYKES